MKNYQVSVQSYNPKWANLFIDYKKELSMVLQEIEILHIGSTSIPNMPAKPIIDILGIVNNIADVDRYNSVLQHLGYEPHGEMGICCRRFFTKDLNGERVVNMHIFESVDSEINRYLKFRDYLISHLDSFNDYANLKLDISASAIDVATYLNKKTKFVNDVDKKSGYKGIRLVKTFLDTEAGFEKKLGLLNSDLKIERLVCYINSELAGAAGISFDIATPVLVYAVLDKGCDNLASAELFSKAISRWLLSLNNKQILIKGVYISLTDEIKIAKLIKTGIVSANE